MIAVWACCLDKLSLQELQAAEAEGEAGVGEAEHVRLQTKLKGLQEQLLELQVPELCLWTGAYGGVCACVCVCVCVEQDICCSCCEAHFWGEAHGPAFELCI